MGSVAKNLDVQQGGRRLYVGKGWLRGGLEKDRTWLSQTKGGYKLAGVKRESRFPTEIIGQGLCQRSGSPCNWNPIGDPRKIEK